MANPTRKTAALAIVITLGVATTATANGARETIVLSVANPSSRRHSSLPKTSSARFRTAKGE